MNFATGTYAGWEYVPPNNHGELINSAHIYDICYVNNTVLYRPDTYPWLEYGGALFTWNKNKFPWVLYARKLRSGY